jgi:hypothetical protein
MTEQPALPPLLAAASTLELDRDAASSGESDDYRRGMTRAVELLRMLNEDEPAGQARDTDRAALVEAAAQAIRDSNGSPEALEWWRTHPQLIPAHVYAAAALAVMPAPADRAAVLNQAADFFRGLHATGTAITAQEVEAELRRMAAAPAAVSAVPGQADGETSGEAQPRRGDQFEAWLKAQRDEYEVRSSPQWAALDEVLDTYRLHADMGVQLDGHVCEGRVVGDCECLEQPAAGAQQPKEADAPHTVCVCGHTRGEHLRVSGRLLCDSCDPDSTDNLVCKEFEAL